MLRSPAAAQLPDNLRLPLESAIACARASPEFTFGMLPANTSTTADGAAPMLGTNVTNMTAGVPFGGYPIEEQQVSVVEGVKISGEASAHASTGLDLSPDFLDGFLDEAPRLSQEPDGADGNFTQPLSPSIWTAARASAGTENTAGMNAALQPALIPDSLVLATFRMLFQSTAVLNLYMRCRCQRCNEHSRGLSVARA